MPLEHKLARYLPHEAARMGVRVLQPAKYRNFMAMRGTQLRPFVEERCLFVHIPKCAGTSVVEALFGQPVANHRTIAALRVAFPAEEYRSLFKFTFVRNPWDRLVSTFHYLRDAEPGTRSRYWADRLIPPGADFGTFVRTRIDGGNLERAYHLRPQSQFICLGSDRVHEMDFVGRFESVAADFEIVARRLGIEANLPERNRGRSRPHGYRDQYDDETRAIVARAYARDVELFGYEF